MGGRPVIRTNCYFQLSSFSLHCEGAHQSVCFHCWFLFKQFCWVVYARLCSFENGEGLPKCFKFPCKLCEPQWQNFVPRFWSVAIKNRSYRPPSCLPCLPRLAFGRAQRSGFRFTALPLPVSAVAGSSWTSSNSASWRKSQAGTVTLASEFYGIRS